MDKADYRKAVATEMARPLAEFLLETAKVREESYDHVASDVAETSAENNNMIYNFNDYYKLSIQQAAEQVCPPLLVEPVAMLLRNNWNESLDWANKAVL